MRKLLDILIVIKLYAQINIFRMFQRLSDFGYFEYLVKCLEHTLDQKNNNA